MDGKARFTMETSRKTMNWPRQMKARIGPGRKPGPGPDRLLTEPRPANTHLLRRGNRLVESSLACVLAWPLFSKA